MNVPVRLPVLLVMWLVISILALGACTTSDSTTTTPSVVIGEAVVFGEGAIPSVFPDAFPVPNEAVVGATMVDGTRSVVEIVFTTPASVTASVAYFETNLPARGYTISASQGDAAQWHAEFFGDGIASGSINLGSGGPGITLGTIQLELSS